MVDDFGLQGRFILGEWIEKIAALLTLAVNDIFDVSPR